MDYISHGWGMGFGWLLPLLIIGLLFYLFQNQTEKKSTNSSAQEILDKRYANGGIDKKEYEEKSEAIKKQGIEG
jgi:putative membrane protein